MQTLYADGLGNVTLIEGVIRIELVSLTEVDKEKANVRPVGLLALSVPGLIRFHEQLGKAIEGLKQQGALVEQEIPKKSVT
jgi:hypothetical protein